MRKPQTALKSAVAESPRDEWMNLVPGIALSIHTQADSKSVQQTGGMFDSHFQFESQERIRSRIPELRGTTHGGKTGVEGVGLATLKRRPNLQHFTYTVRFATDFFSR